MELKSRFGLIPRICLGAGIAKTLALAAPDPLFTPIRVDTVVSEACALADVDRDGKVDIIAGNFWYEVPTWKKHKFRTLAGAIDPQGVGFYSNDFDLPIDLDGDGWLDLVTGGEATGLRWYRNTASSEGNWPEVKIDSGDHHSAELMDIDGDGKKQEIFSGKVPARWYEPGNMAGGAPGLVRHVVTTKDHNWGYGVGDINGDGRADLIRPDVWFEAPENPRTGTWKEHCLALGYLDTGDPKNPNVVFPLESGCGATEHTQQIWVYDVDKDGLNDLITGGAHTYGLFWYRQSRDVGGNISFTRKIIDQSWSQVHATNLADVDQDGDLDILTGKRWRAHGDGDPGGTEPPGVYWYELTKADTVKWIKHVVSYNQGIGVGVNVSVGDLDGDGDLDFVATSKAGGPFLFKNNLNPVGVFRNVPGLLPKTARKTAGALPVLRYDGQNLSYLPGGSGYGVGLGSEGARIEDLSGATRNFLGRFSGVPYRLP